ncbi:putative ureidoglycolate hydrolase [Piptocephalis cylindrospora]|uniref:Putative ureidoglycolate hydrolase n=1 Tax=Piptocephalis cylindrospora TaxID=1907219 RepID=A0A4P9Y0I4_9FUNG|nr:putative ureidoglycolate hydrolase [Piptocephalis cylindrospora]|eukprot:RKP12237.1 putative ureidoglycolate hydrolase [Piptocephalis cylindrospora]
MLFIQTTPLTQEAFSRYGQVMQHPTKTQDTIMANAGTAQRTNHLAEPRSAFPAGSGAKANFCVFRCSPIQSRPIPIGMLERHPYSTQAFIPMGPANGMKDLGRARYLVVVASTLPDGTPDWPRLEAFLALPGQAIQYTMGTWHHPMISLDRTMDFTCLVWESGVAEENCQVAHPPSNGPSYHIDLGKIE